MADAAFQGSTETPTLPGAQRSLQGNIFCLKNKTLARLYAVLLDQDLVPLHSNDPYLARQVESRNIENNTALFLCAAVMEKAIEGRGFSNDPANTLTSYLRGEFRKRGWRWPKHPYAWKQYFIHHHAKTLSGKN